MAKKLVKQSDKDKDNEKDKDKKKINKDKEQTKTISTSQVAQSNICEDKALTPKKTKSKSEHRTVCLSSSPIKKNKFSLLAISQQIKSETQRQISKPSSALKSNNDLKFMPISSVAIERKKSIISMELDNEYDNCIKNDKDELKRDDKKTLINELKSRFERVDSMGKQGKKNKKEIIVIKADKFIQEDQGKVQETEKIKGNLLNIIEEQENKKLIVPTTLPFISEDKEKDYKLERKLSSEQKETFELKEDEPFILQFPRIMPFDQNKDQVETSEEPQTEESEFVNSFNQLKNSSHIGKMRIYKSGKIKLIIGDIVYDVTQGMRNSFTQELVNENESNFYLLNKVKPEKLIVSPDI